MRLSVKANGTSCLVFVVPKQGANLRLTVSASNACIPSLVQQCDLARDEKPWRLLQPGFMVYGGGLIWCMVYVWWGPDKVQHGFVINCVRLCLTDPPEINTVPSCTQKAQQILSNTTQAHKYNVIWSRIAQKTRQQTDKTCRTRQTASPPTKPHKWKYRT